MKNRTFYPFFISFFGGVFAFSFFSLDLSILVVLVALIAAGVFLVAEKDAPTPTSAQVVSVPFTELTQGVNANVSRRVNYLITSEEGLKELWKLLDAQGTPPTVDFSSPNS